MSEGNVQIVSRVNVGSGWEIRMFSDGAVCAVSSWPGEHKWMASPIFRGASAEEDARRWVATDGATKPDGTVANGTGCPSWCRSLVGTGYFCAKCQLERGVQVEGWIVDGASVRLKVGCEVAVLTPERAREVAAGLISAAMIATRNRLEEADRARSDSVPVR